MHGRGSFRGVGDRPIAVVIFSYLTYMVPLISQLRQPSRRRRWE